MEIYDERKMSEITVGESRREDHARTAALRPIKDCGQEFESETSVDGLFCTHILLLMCLERSPLPSGFLSIRCIDIAPVPASSLPSLYPASVFFLTLTPA